MFTGIVTDVGRVRAIEQRGDTRIVIQTAYDMDTVDIGASIACSGACLTVVDKGSDGAPGGDHRQDWFAADVSAESLSKTTLGGWSEGTEVNLERPLTLGAELGGHLMTGHIDGLATIISVTREGDSRRVIVETPAELEGFVAAKGSVALDGISLTVNAVEGRRFGINIIPHTWERTTFRARGEGDSLNMEVDLMARYVARLLATNAAAAQE